MNQEQKPKMKLWKKITIGVVFFLIVMAVIGNFLDKYDLGVSAYKKQDYESAYNYFKRVKPDHKYYADAVKMAEISKIKMDSVRLVETTLEKLKKDKELAEINTKPSTQTQAPVEKAAAEISLKTIPGIVPGDIYTSLEKNGFTIEKEFSTENGCFWHCKFSSDGLDYYVRIFGSTTSVVEEIKAQATINTADNIQASKSFFNFIASIPYDNADNEQVSNWLKNNFNKDKQSITISGVTFSIYSPTKLTKLLTIETKK